MTGKAGLFAGEVTQAAPADGSPTTKQKGYHWMEWGEDILPPCRFNSLLLAESPVRCYFFQEPTYEDPTAYAVDYGTDGVNLPSRFATGGDNPFPAVSLRRTPCSTQSAQCDITPKQFGEQSGASPGINQDHLIGKTHWTIMGACDNWDNEQGQFMVVSARDSVLSMLFSFGTRAVGVSGFEAAVRNSDGSVTSFGLTAGGGDIRAPGGHIFVLRRENNVFSAKVDMDYSIFNKACPTNATGSWDLDGFGVGEQALGVDYGPLRWDHLAVFDKALSDSTIDALFTQWILEKV